MGGYTTSNWLLTDEYPDVYYSLGYAIATKRELAETLRYEYHSKFGYKSWGVSRNDFREFYNIWEKGHYIRHFEKDWGDKESFRLKLEDFFKKKEDNVKEESGWRPHQMVQLDDANFSIRGPNGEFAEGWGEYALVQGADSNTATELLVRKRLFKQTLDFCEDPMAMHRAREDNTLRNFVDTEHRKNQIELPDHVLKLIWQPETVPRC